MNLIDAVPAPAENGEATTLAHALFDEVIAPAAAEETPSYFAPAGEPDRATYFLQPSLPQLTPKDFEFPGGGDADGLIEALVEHWTKQGETRLATSGQRLKEIIAALRAEGVGTDGDVDPYCYTMF